MFQLYKKRGFSDYLNDSFAFVKLAKGHFIKNYAIICGGFLLILTILGYVLGKAYMTFIFGSVGGNFRLENIFGGNIPLFIGVLVFFFIALIIFSFLSYLFPVVYLRLFEENDHFEFTTKDIGDRIRANLGRTIKFSLLSLLMTFTLGLLVFALLILMFITIIGIPFAIIGMFAFLALYNIAFYLYINNREVGYIDSFKITFEFVRHNLWPIVGSNFAMYMVINIVSTIITMIPMVIGMASLFSNINTADGGGLPETGGFAVATGITFALSFLVTYALQNLLILNNGMIYYTMQEVNHSHNTKSEIDLIGKESEF